jgi:uncharacterized protein
VTDSRMVVRRFVETVRNDTVAWLLMPLGALVIVIAQFVFSFRGVYEFFPDARHPLANIGWWVGGLVILWGVIPAAAAYRLGFGMVDIGFGRGRLREHLPVYGLALAVMVAVVAAVSFVPSFVSTYPMVKFGFEEYWTWTVLLVFWMLYAVQFVCVEALFRGALLFPLAGRIGPSAVPILTVPYALIHFQKPLPEAVGAVFAGLFLGWLALEARSIWGGVALHVSVALSMDVAAMFHTGFPRGW